eukprot:2924192-Rhodomonas_salina.3
MGGSDGPSEGGVKRRGATAKKPMIGKRSVRATGRWQLGATIAYRLDHSLSSDPPAHKRPPNPNQTDHPRSRQDHWWPYPDPPWADPSGPRPCTAPSPTVPHTCRRPSGGRESCGPSLASPLSANPAPRRQPRLPGAPSSDASPLRPLRACPSWFPPEPGTPDSGPVKEGGRAVLGSYSVCQRRRLV